MLHQKVKYETSFGIIFLKYNTYFDKETILSLSLM